MQVPVIALLAVSLVIVGSTANLLNDDTQMMYADLIRLVPGG